MAVKKMKTISDYPFYLNFIKENSKRLFNNKEEVDAYLSEDVFSKVDFQNNVKEVASNLKISYHLAYVIITNNLIDTLYEIDIAQSLPRKKTRIIIQGVLSIDIGFVRSLLNRKFYLKHDISSLIKIKREI